MQTEEEKSWVCEKEYHLLCNVSVLLPPSERLVCACECHEEA